MICDNIKFDCVLMFEVLEHLENQKDVVDKIKLILKNGGILIGSVPIQPSCKNKQHIGYFRCIDDVKKLGLCCYTNYRLKLPESILIYYIKNLECN